MVEVKNILKSIPRLVLREIVDLDGSKCPVVNGVADGRFATPNPRWTLDTKVLLATCIELQRENRALKLQETPNLTQIWIKWLMFGTFICYFALIIVGIFQVRYSVNSRDIDSLIKVIEHIGNQRSK
jgi:hypothetical protein